MDLAALRLCRTPAAALAALALSAAAAPALAGTVLFSDDFQSTVVKPVWSSNTTINTQSASNFTWFAGRYSDNNGITLSLTAPAAPIGFDNSNNGDSGGGSGGSGNNGGLRNTYTLSFDFYCIDSWDGNDPNYGPDRFTVTHNNTTTLFNESFGNVYPIQSFRAPTIGPANLGFSTAFPDSIYRKILVKFDTPDNQPYTLRFASLGLQNIDDESWGIDNVRVIVDVVPAPSSLALLGGSGLLAFRRRR